MPHTDYLPQLDDNAASHSLKVGKYEARFARNHDEIAMAQELRYQVFFKELREQESADNAEVTHIQRDSDEWDHRARHIMVFEYDRKGNAKLAGTLRMTWRSALLPGQKLYTEQYFDLDKLCAAHDKVIELGRFCIAPDARSGAILRILWKLGMDYIANNEIDLMLGCASMPGNDVEKHADLLSYVYHNHRAPDSLMPRAIVDNSVSINLREPREMSRRELHKAIPPLIRGYFQLGAQASEEAIIDPVFNTIFVCLYVDGKAMRQLASKLVTA